MSNIENSPGASGARSESVPTAAFFADPNAAVFLLRETVSTMLATYAIKHAYVDISTLGGLTIAAELLQAGIAYEILDFGQEPPQPLPEAPGSDHRFKPNRPRTMHDYSYLAHMSAGVHRIDVGELASIDANLILIPSIAGAHGGEQLIDFTPSTVVGAVFSEAEELGRDILVIAPPERGLRAAGGTGNERYERQVVLVRTESRIHA